MPLPSTTATQLATPAAPALHTDVQVPRAQDAQERPEMPGPFHLAGSLFVVIAVIFAAAFFLRRVQGLRGGAQGAVTLKGGLQVGARERVLLIEAQGRRVLVGVAPGSVRALHVFDAAENVAIPESLPVQPAAFAEKLKSLLKGAS